jgi:hypothetical protein
MSLYVSFIDVTHPVAVAIPEELPRASQRPLREGEKAPPVVV